MNLILKGTCVPLLLMLTLVAPAAAQLGPPLGEANRDALRREVIAEQLRKTNRRLRARPKTRHIEPPEAADRIRDFVATTDLTECLRLRGEVRWLQHRLARILSGENVTDDRDELTRELREAEAARDRACGDLERFIGDLLASDPDLRVFEKSAGREVLARDVPDDCRHFSSFALAPECRFGLVTHVEYRAYICPGVTRPVLTEHTVEVTDEPCAPDSWSELLGDPSFYKPRRPPPQARSMAVVPLGDGDADPSQALATLDTSAPMQFSLRQLHGRVVLESITPPPYGEVTLGAGGLITYHPHPQVEPLHDSFFYVVRDIFGRTNEYAVVPQVEETRAEAAPAENAQELEEAPVLDRAVLDGSNLRLR